MNLDLNLGDFKHSLGLSVRQEVKRKSHITLLFSCARTCLKVLLELASVRVLQLVLLEPVPKWVEVSKNYHRVERRSVHFPKQSFPMNRFGWASHTSESFNEAKACQRLRQTRTRRRRRRRGEREATVQAHTRRGEAESPVHVRARTSLSIAVSVFVSRIERVSEKSVSA